MFKYVLKAIPENKNFERRSIQGKKFFKNKPVFANEELDLDVYLNLIEKVEEDKVISVEQDIIEEETINIDSFDFNNIEAYRKQDLMSFIMDNSKENHNKSDLNKMKKVDLINLISIEFDLKIEDKIEEREE